MCVCGVLDFDQECKLKEQSWNLEELDRRILESGSDQISAEAGLGGARGIL